MKLPFQLQATETVSMVLRRHWVHLYPRLALLVLAAVAPPIGLWVGADAIGDPSGAVRIVLLAVMTIWAAYWLTTTYLLWYRYEHDVWIVTDQRLVDSLKRHWFHHQMSSVDLADIEDVSVERDGVFRTMFDYGDVQVQTAAQRANFVLSAIPHPSDVLTQVDAARDLARRGTIPN